MNGVIVHCTLFMVHYDEGLGIITIRKEKKNVLLSV